MINTKDLCVPDGFGLVSYPNERPGYPALGHNATCVVFTCQTELRPLASASVPLKVDPHPPAFPVPHREGYQAGVASTTFFVQICWEQDQGASARPHPLHSHHALLPTGLGRSHGPRRKLGRWPHDVRRRGWHELAAVHGAAGLPRGQQRLHAASAVRPLGGGLPGGTWARIWRQVRQSFRYTKSRKAKHHLSIFCPLDFLSNINGKAGVH